MKTFNELINSEQPVLVDFFAEWCGPCKMMTPILSEVSSKIGTNAKIIKVDIDKNKNAANKYNVMSVPTLVIFKKGEIKWRGNGVVKADKLIKTLQLFV